MHDVSMSVHDDVAMLVYTMVACLSNNEEGREGTNEKIFCIFVFFCAHH